MSERRTGWLLLAILGVQLVLLAAQVPAEDGQRSLLETVTLRLVAPVARLVAGVGESFGGLRRGVRLRGELADENRELRQKVERLERELARRQGLELEVDRLSRALDYTRQSTDRLVPAELVYLDPSGWLGTLILYVGGGEVQVDQPVLTSRGLVGRVTLVAGRYARVQLVTDRAAAVGAMLERTGRQGIARGAGARGLELDYLPLSSEVRRGDRVVTAGIDGIYPAGIPVGTVARVERGTDLFHRVTLDPAVDLRLLGDLFVLEHEGPPEKLSEPEGDG